MDVLTPDFICQNVEFFVNEGMREIGAARVDRMNLVIERAEKM
jgi:hypothetical protein